METEQLTEQNIKFKFRYEWLEQEKKLESAKLNQARYINVDFTDRLSTNNQSNVNIDNPDTNYFNIDNAKKQTAYIRDINVALKESIKFLHLKRAYKYSKPRQQTRTCRSQQNDRQYTTEKQYLGSTK
jgi:hypothetical protein